MLKNKCVVIGVTGSVAAYKIPNLVSKLVKSGVDVNVVMTKNATEFITPYTFETLTKNKCIVDTFDKNFTYDVKHISLERKADLFVVAPASANVIGKIANGICDDMLTTTAITLTCKKLIFPAMNTNMYLNPVLQDNLEKLRKYGYEVVEPATGYLACGDTGVGKMPEIEEIYEYILRELAHEKDLAGKKVLVTAGPTMEKIDPVRYITNHSSGKMGYAIAKNCMLRGADVTLVTGKTSLKKPDFVKIIEIESAEEMFNEVTKISSKMDFIFKAAAVADYTPKIVADNKLKKKDDELNIELKRTKDILKFLGENKGDKQIICGFSMETENMEENSRKKLENKNLDIIVANNLKQEGAGFKTDTNLVTVITKDSLEKLPLMSKDEVAERVVSKAIELSE